DVVVLGKCVEIGARGSGGRQFLVSRCSKLGGLRRVVLRRWIGRKGEAVALLKSSDVLHHFLAGVADLQKIAFAKGNAGRKEFGQGTVQILAERSLRSVLKDVRQLGGHLGKVREAVAGRSSAEGVGGDVQPLQVLAARLDLLKYADVFPQVLQVLGSFLKED